MEIFNIIVGIFTIVGTIATLFTATKVFKLSQSIKQDNSVTQKAKGRFIRQGRDTYIHSSNDDKSN